jgi:hypothetical protein
VIDEAIAVLPPASPAAAGSTAEAAAAPPQDRPATAASVPLVAVMTSPTAAAPPPEAASPSLPGQFTPVAPDAAAEPDSKPHQAGQDVDGTVTELALTRLPDDPGPEPDRAPPARRSFWGWQRT